MGISDKGEVVCFFIVEGVLELDRFKLRFSCVNC